MTPPTSMPQPEQPRGLPRLGLHRRDRTEADPSRRGRSHHRARPPDRRHRVRRHRADHALHVAGRAARRRQLPLLRRSGTWRVRRSVAARTRPRELHDAHRHRSGRGDHAVEHAVHAQHLEDRPRPCGGMHGRAQARRVESRSPRSSLPRSPSKPACRPACSTWCTAWVRPRARASPNIGPSRRSPSSVSRAPAR